jgi:glycine oxidase
MEVTVIGAGVAGLTCAVELAERGVQVQVVEQAEALGRQCCSWFAGGMLAPWCEIESADTLIADLGTEGIAWWRDRVADIALNGSLVLAQGRDIGQLTQFSRRTQRFEWLDGAGIAALEPDLAGRFNKALLFRDEGYLEPRNALAALARRLDSLGGRIRYGVSWPSLPPTAQGTAATKGWVLDCTGLAARHTFADLRGVKGEMLIVRLPEISLSRPVRVLHPRVPVYVVPRGDGLFMIGATMIESDQPTRISARSMLELLSAAYALHSAFGEAEILEIGTGVRPAFPDNLPRVRRAGKTLHVNGLYRHGFLIAPALARRVAETLLHGRYFPEVMDENHRERRFA